MNKLGKTILYSTLALLLAAIPATLLARPQSSGFGGGWGGGFMRGHMFERVAEHLDLSDQQREQIHAVHEVYREDMQALVDEMTGAQRDLNDQIRGDTFDEAEIRQASARAAAVSADLAVLRARIHGDVRQILTPEQLEQAQEMHEMFSEFAGEWRGRHRGPHGRQPFTPEDD